MVTVIIPTLNEEETLENIIQRCRPFAREILIIDGQSTDRTVDIARAAGARVELYDQRGKGAALRHGARIAQDEIIVFVDADGSHRPEDIPQLIEPLIANKADLVVASRQLGGSSELHGGIDEFFRLVGSAFITLCINKRFGVSLSDSQNGFRAVKRDVFLNLALRSPLTTIEQEMTMKALAMGYRVTEIPSHELARQGGVSKIQILRLWPVYLIDLLRGLSQRKRHPPKQP